MRWRTGGTVGRSRAIYRNGGKRRKHFRADEQARTKETTLRRVIRHWVVEIREVEGIKETPFVRNVPGRAEIRRGHDAAALHIATLQIVVEVGAGFTAVKGLAESEYIRIAARITCASGKIEVLPVIGLETQLFRRRARTHSSLAKEIKVCAARGVHGTKRRPIERPAARLVGSRVKRHSEIYQLAVRKRE